MPIISRRRRRSDTAGGAESANATNLQITTQPGLSGTSPYTLSPQPVVAAKKSLGTTDTAYATNVVATLNVLTGSPVLSGTTTKAPVSGVATFTDLVVTGAGTWTITFTSGTLSSATTSTGTTTASGVTTLAADTFDRTAGTLTTASDGGTWTTVGPFNTDGTNATCASASSSATRDFGQVNYTMTVPITDTASACASLNWCMTDASNRLLFGTSSPTQWYIIKKVAGVDTNYFAETVDIANGDVIKLVTKYLGVDGDTAIYRNGVYLFTHHEPTDLHTGTKGGLNTTGALVGTAKWGDFLVTT